MVINVRFTIPAIFDVSMLLISSASLKGDYLVSDSSLLLIKLDN